MKLRSLFVKIFLWFWLANTVVVASLALVMWLYPFSGPPRHGTLHRLHDLQVRGALAILETKGKTAFEEHVKELEKATGLKTFWLDEAGHEIRGQSVPDSFLKSIQEHDARIPGTKQMHEMEPVPREFYTRPMIFDLTDSKGHRYHALTEPMGPRPTPYLQQLVSSRVFILRVLAVVSMAGLGCYALAKYLSMPVRKLQHATRRLAAGDLAVRVEKSLASRHDEIGELGRDFDRMAQQVEALVTTQKRLLWDVSHELRSPLARLNVALDLAERDATPATEQMLSRVRREAERVNRLIGQLLTLARLEGGMGQSQHMPIGLHSLVAEVVADADFEASARNRRVRVSRNDPCELLGVTDLLRSAIENVVRNAVHATAENTEVNVSLRKIEVNGLPSAKLEIVDHGPGVPEEALQDIFRPFYRVSNNRDSNGTGLGLAISQRAVRLHGGEIRASNAPIGGLVIEIILPCSIT